ncbi:MAG: BlaI/MecI/CopY family transcriptional regulator [Planctomycetota bacterium]
MRRIKPLSALQLAVLQVLWQKPEATVGEVHASLQAERSLALTTVATLLTRLEKRGLLTHRIEGRQFVYRALVSEHDTRATMLTELTDRLFQGDITAVVSHLLKSREVKKGDLARVKALIEAEAQSRSIDKKKGGSR